VLPFGDADNFHRARQRRVRHAHVEFRVGHAELAGLVRDGLRVVLARRDVGDGQLGYTGGDELHLVAVLVPAGGEVAPGVPPVLGGVRVRGLVGWHVY